MISFPISISWCFLRFYRNEGMTAWNSWECLAPAAPWAGAALLLLAGIVAVAGVWARWKPKPSDEVAGMPLLLRWMPALTLGAGCAAVVWLATSAAQQEVQAGASAAALLGLTALGAVWLDKVGQHTVRRETEAAFWMLNAEGVTTHLRRILRQDEMLSYAAKTVMQELEAGSIRVFLLKNGHFELAASLPSVPAKPESFEKQGVLAQAFLTAGREPFLEFAIPATGVPGSWMKQLGYVGADDLQAEQRKLESLNAETGVGFWREAKLAGFFLIGGRLTSNPLSAPQRLFAAEIASQVGRLLDVMEAAEKLAQESAAKERAKADREMAALVRSRMTPPDMAELTGMEYGVSVEKVTGGPASFCDAVVLPGSALGIVMAETSAGGLQMAVEMVRLQTLLRSRFYVYGEDLREMLDSVERALRMSEGTVQPVRLLLGRYDASTLRFIYVNAGYLPPVFLRNRSNGSETLRLAATGRPLAGEGPADWKVQEIEMRHRDMLLTISPGLLHRADSLEKWGENQLLETMLDLEKHPAAAIAHRLVREAADPDNANQSTSERSVIVLRPTEAAVRPLTMPSQIAS
jgi:serine phosphatase RsbU (regulator of sigma subunit)